MFVYVDISSAMGDLAFLRIGFWVCRYEILEGVLSSLLLLLYFNIIIGVQYRYLCPLGGSCLEATRFYVEGCQ